MELRNFVDSYFIPLLAKNNQMTCINKTNNISSLHFTIEIENHIPCKYRETTIGY
jgi:hypothetical protein